MALVPSEILLFPQLAAIALAMDGRFQEVVVVAYFLQLLPSGCYPHFHYRSAMALNFSWPQPPR